MQEYRLDTPESVAINYRLAGIGTRFIAVAIDTLFQIAILITIGIGAVIFAQAGAVGRTAAIILFSTLSFVVVWGYYLLFEALWEGRTPGKRVVGVRVIKTSGRPISFADSAIRNLVRIIDFLPGFYGLGVLVMFISPQPRRLGDYAASTVVVRERDRRPVEAWAGPPPYEPLVRLGENDPDEWSWDLRGLEADDIALARSFLARAPSLPDDARGRIAGEIAEPIRERIGAREAFDASRFLARVVQLVDMEENREARGAADVASYPGEPAEGGR